MIKADYKLMCAIYSFLQSYKFYFKSVALTASWSRHIHVGQPIHLTTLESFDHLSGSSWALGIEHFGHVWSCLHPGDKKYREIIFPINFKICNWKLFHGLAFYRDYTNRGLRVFNIFTQEEKVNNRIWRISCSSLLKFQYFYSACTHTLMLVTQVHCRNLKPHTH